MHRIVSGSSAWSAAVAFRSGTEAGEPAADLLRGGLFFRLLAQALLFPLLAFMFLGSGLGLLLGSYRNSNICSTK
ncbi:hypothetical protein [Streptomyces sp. NPDC053720]|uniref:hypothetical protein n=1 Tax=Streptomyces sp. NPDC053720 TaxID=3154855 RepID=UPI003434BB5E